MAPRRRRPKTAGSGVRLLSPAPPRLTSPHRGRHASAAHAGGRRHREFESSSGASPRSTPHSTPRSSPHSTPRGFQNPSPPKVKGARRPRRSSQFPREASAAAVNTGAESAPSPLVHNRHNLSDKNADIELLLQQMGDDTVHDTVGTIFSEASAFAAQDGVSWMAWHETEGCPSPVSPSPEEVNDGEGRAFFASTSVPAVHSVNVHSVNGSPEPRRTERSAFTEPNSQTLEHSALRKSIKSSASFSANSASPSRSLRRHDTLNNWLSRALGSSVTQNDSPRTRELSEMTRSSAMSVVQALNPDDAIEKSTGYAFPEQTLLREIDDLQWNHTRVVWYFAYGSNQKVDRFTSRVGRWHVRVPLKLNGWKLFFNKAATTPGQGHANVVPSEHSVTYGIGYLLPRSRLNSLDVFEGVRNGHYDRTELLCRTLGNGRAVRCHVYIASSDMTSTDLRPARDYLSCCLGAADLLPTEYVAAIRATPTFR
eukprot:Hpha_TRINITY_DN15109_c0_g3::TRINITY_DN15109_c0_g3_i1::g.130193::m.130193